MKKTIMQITDYCIKGLEKQVGYRVCIDDLSIMNEVDELENGKFNYYVPPTYLNHIKEMIR